MMNVTTFSYLMISLYLAFGEPKSKGSRLTYDPGSTAHKALAGAVWLFDWTRRFSLGAGEAGQVIEIWPADGGPVRRGGDALVTVGGLLPQIDRPGVVAGWTGQVEQAALEWCLGDALGPCRGVGGAGLERDLVAGNDHQLDDCSGHNKQGEAGAQGASVGQPVHKQRKSKGPTQRCRHRQPMRQGHACQDLVPVLNVVKWQGDGGAGVGQHGGAVVQQHGPQTQHQKRGAQCKGPTQPSGRAATARQPWWW